MKSNQNNLLNSVVDNKQDKNHLQAENKIVHRIHISHEFDCTEGPARKYSTC